MLTVRTRTGRDITNSLPELAGLPAAVGQDVVLDAELVSDGTGDGFARIAGRMASRKAEAAARTPLCLVVFDCLWLGGDITRAALEERRAALGTLGLDGDHWRLTPRYPGEDAAHLFAACDRLGVEGIIAKRRGSIYRPGQRSKDWIKAKTPAWRERHGPTRIPAGRRPSQAAPVAGGSYGPSHEASSCPPRR